MLVKTFEDEANEVAKKLGYGANTVGSELIRQALLSAYENGKAFQQSVQSDGGVCTCKKPIATTSTNNQCGNCGKPRRR